MHPERDASKVAKRERRSTVCKSLAPRQPALDEADKRILDHGGILILCAYWAVMAKNRDSASRSLEAPSSSSISFKPFT